MQVVRSSSPAYGQYPQGEFAYLFLDCLYVKRLRVLEQSVMEEVPSQFQMECIRNVFSELTSDHLLCYLYFDICLSVVHSKAQTDKVREDGCGAFRGADRGCAG